MKPRVLSVVIDLAAIGAAMATVDHFTGDFTDALFAGILTGLYGLWCFADGLSI